MRISDGVQTCALPISCLLPTSLRCQDNYFVSIRQTAAPTAASSPSETNISMRVPSHGASTSDVRSEEHTSELQSLMRISYAVFCLKKKKQNTHKTSHKLHILKTH